MLNFTLPKELYAQINEYEIRKTEAPKKTVTVVDPLVSPKAGIPEFLVPTNIITRNELIQIINSLNQRMARSRWRSSDAFDQYYTNNNIHVYITLTYNKKWSALWFDSSLESDIAFSYSTCIRDLKSYKEKFKKNNFDVNYNKIKHNKKAYLYSYNNATRTDLLNRTFNINDISLPYSIQNNFRSDFIAQLKKYITVWDKSSNPFEHYTTTIASYFGYSKEYKNNLWIPDFDYVIKSSKISNNSLIEKLNTPFFTKKINKYIAEFVSEFNSNEWNSGNTYSYYKPCILKRIIQVLTEINTIFEQYPNMSVDYIQKIWNYYDEKGLTDITREFIILSPLSRCSDKLEAWITKNIKIGSFINMYTVDTRNLSDTFSMIREILYTKKDLIYRGRWRNREFHDWVMSEHWKINNTNQKLPQDLFPAPIKVGNITFIQPICTHQLAEWGKAARNCVGSRSYYEGITNKKHFIILALENNDPYLTIQARVENSELKVVQIYKNCNQSMREDEKLKYTKSFTEALGIRAKQLEEQQPLETND